MKYPETESVALEFKRELPKNDQIIKTIIGFCNRYGGKLIIGVDNDRTILGLPEQEIQKVLEYLDKTIHEACSPPIVPNIFTQSFDGKIILIVEVSEGMHKPYYITSEGIEKGTYVRLGRNTLRASPHMLIELKDESRVRSFDMRPVYDATREDLDTAAIEIFLKKRKQQTGKEAQKVLFDEALHAYHLVIKEQNKEFPTTAGILLFGKKPQHFFTEAFIVASQFVGKSLREVLATRDFTGSLIDQYQEAVAFVVSRLSHSYTIQGSLRVEKLEIPQEALREAILNAIVHRSYLIPSSIEIAIFDNRIEIFSPGGFIGPLNQKNLLDGYSYIRNLAIAKVFRELGYIEKMGTGFKIIFESYAARNLPAPQVIEGEDYVKVILPRPSPDYRPPEFSSEQQEPIDDSQKIIKLLARYEKLTISHVLQELNIPRATAGRRLAHLVKQGTLRKIGEKRGAWYTKQKRHRATAEIG